MDEGFVFALKYGTRETIVVEDKDAGLSAIIDSFESFLIGCGYSVELVKEALSGNAGGEP